MVLALRSAKLRRHLIQFKVTAEERSLFSATIEASLLKKVVAARPMPPVVDETSGVNVA